MRQANRRGFAVLPEIAALHERMARGGAWMAFRTEIADLHKQATTQDEYVELLHAHSLLGHLIDEVYDADTAEKIRAAHQAEYRLFLNTEALENGERINPAILAQITAREVEAGRLDPDDDFRQLAAAGGQVLGDSSYLDAKPARRGNWATAAIAGLAVILWALSIRPLGVSALWLIAIGFIVGWYINDREMKAVKHRAELERARRGY